MNYELPVYREAFKMNQSMPMDEWALLWLLERYVNGAVAQLDRIARSLDDSFEYDGTWLLDQIGLDVHYYFICWDKARNLLKQLASIHSNPEMSEIWGQFYSICRPFNDARNHLEHIDERLQRDPKNTGSMAGNYFAIAGERFDITQAGLKLLTDMYEDVIFMLTLRIDDRRPTLDEFHLHTPRPTVHREAMTRRERDR